MKTHDLAAELLSKPNIEVMGYDFLGPLDISSVQPYTITQKDEDCCGCCDGRVGEEVFVIYVKN
jgi:hypothetical protein